MNKRKSKGVSNKNRLTEQLRIEQNKQGDLKEKSFDGTVMEKKIGDLK